MSAQVVQELLASLTRGTTVVVGETGEKMLIASKGTVKCNGKGCAAGCVGLALFVTRPDDFVATPSSDNSWRTGTTKICLSHLLGPKNTSLLEGISAADVLATQPKEEQEKTAKIAEAIKNAPALKKRRGRPRKNPLPESEVETPGEAETAQIDETGEIEDEVTWDMLTQAVAENDWNALMLHARALKHQAERQKSEIIVLLRRLAK